MQLGERTKKRREEVVRYWGNENGSLNWAQFKFHGECENRWSEFEGVIFLGLWKFDRHKRMMITPAIGIGRKFISQGIGYVHANSVTMI